MNLRKAKYVFFRIKKTLKRAYQRAQGKEFIHFLHIGKTGGSAIKHALKQPMNSNQAIWCHGHKIRLKDIPEGDRFFFFLRDPVSRFVSGFYSRKRQEMPRYFVPWDRDEKLAFERFSTPNQLAMALSSQEPKVQQQAKHAMNNIGHIMASYWFWLHNEEYFKSRSSDLLYVGFQENLVRDFDRIKSITGWPDHIRLPDHEFDTHKTPDSFDKHLEDKAITNLKSWYKKDFELIELCKSMFPNREELGKSSA